jgi:hypothetical protein
MRHFGPACARNIERVRDMVRASGLLCGHVLERGFVRHCLRPEYGHDEMDDPS